MKNQIQVKNFKIISAKKYVKGIEHINGLTGFIIDLPIMNGKIYCKYCEIQLNELGYCENCKKQFRKLENINCEHINCNIEADYIFTHKETNQKRYFCNFHKLDFEKHSSYLESIGISNDYNKYNIKTVKKWQ